MKFSNRPNHSGFCRMQDFKLKVEEAEDYIKFSSKKRAKQGSLTLALITGGKKLNLIITILMTQLFPVYTSTTLKNYVARLSGVTKNVVLIRLEPFIEEQIVCLEGIRKR